MNIFDTNKILLENQKLKKENAQLNFQILCLRKSYIKNIDNGENK